MFPALGREQIGGQALYEVDKGSRLEEQGRSRIVEQGGEGCMLGPGYKCWHRGVCRYVSIICKPLESRPSWQRSLTEWLVESSYGQQAEL